MKSVMTAFFTLLLSFSAYSAIEVYNFDSPEQEQQFQELNQTLRCPKCQNNTIGDSNAELAQDLRQKVYEMTKEGQSKQDIVDYMIARYGNFVTYKPPFTVATAVLWLGPLFVVLFGFALIVMRSKKTATSASTKEKWDEDKEARLNQLLDEESKRKENK